MIIYGHNDYRDYLAHHGILGQRWGKRNGPPYPLAYGDHSASEKRAGWKDSLKKPSKRGDYVPAIFDRNYTELDFRHINVGDLFVRYSEYKQAKEKIRESELYRKSLTIDPETGFYLKKQKGTEKQDMEAVNPGFRNFSPGTKSNCVYCTIAYEMRRRGYDVVAREAAHGIYTEKEMKWFPGSTKTRIGLATRRSASLARFGKNDKLVANAKQFFQEIPNGFRGDLGVYFGNFGGHSLVCEKKNNRVTIRDCQINQKYSEKEFLDGYVGYCAGMECLRLDNADFKLEKIKEIVR